MSGYTIPNVDLAWSEQIEEKYHPYLQRLVAAHTGASRVEILDQRLRFGSESRWAPARISARLTPA